MLSSWVAVFAVWRKTIVEHIAESLQNTYDAELMGNCSRLPHSTRSSVIKQAPRPPTPADAAVALLSGAKAGMEDQTVGHPSNRLEEGLCAITASSKASQPHDRRQGGRTALVPFVSPGSTDHSGSLAVFDKRHSCLPILPRGLPGGVPASAPT